MTNENRRDRMMQRLLQAFRNHGYSQLTMGRLAESCDVTPRALYHHFKGKEDAFRETMRWNHEREIRRGWEAGRWSLADGGSAVDAIVAILDARFGEARRHLELSPHSSELNLEGFRRCRDVMEESAIAFQAGLAVVLTDLEQRGLLRLRRDQDALDAAQMLADGARGVDQTLPNLPADTLPERYRRMTEALVYGFADPATKPSRHGTPPRDDAAAERRRESRLKSEDYADKSA